jgi:hypothetical protein
VWITLIRRIFADSLFLIRENLRHPRHQRCYSTLLLMGTAGAGATAAAASRHIQGNPVGGRCPAVADKGHHPQQFPRFQALAGWAGGRVMGLVKRPSLFENSLTIPALIFIQRHFSSSGIF